VTVLYQDPTFLNHLTGAHPERPERLVAIQGMLNKSGLIRMCHAGSFEKLKVEEVQKVHSPAEVAQLKRLSAQGGGHADADTVLSPASFDVALSAAGACVAAVEAVVAGQHPSALCLVRPPGHHATPVRSMGFCLFNNVALAVRRALDVHGLERVLIVDWDVHHGNGTQDIFYEEPRVMFFSIHRFGYGFYPGTGAADETGTGRGLGYTVNMPLAYGTPRRVYREAYLTALGRAADKIRPELVVVSAGFDAHARDPIGSLGLETEDFATLTQEVLQVAATHAGRRLVSCLEGGYDLTALAEGVQAHLEGLIGAAGDSRS